MHDFEQQLQQKIDALAKESQPERDLWPVIDRQTSFIKQSKFKPWAVAASVVILAGLLAVIWLPMLATKQTSSELLTQLDEQHQQQLNLLLATFSEKTALTANWQKQLQELGEAADAIQKALQQDPNNRALLKMLQQVYQQQIDLVERVHAPRWQAL